jgi:hypothetical protein
MAKKAGWPLFRQRFCINCNKYNVVEVLGIAIGCRLVVGSFVARFHRFHGPQGLEFPALKVVALYRAPIRAIDPLRPIEIGSRESYRLAAGRYSPLGEISVRLGKFFHARRPRRFHYRMESWRH